MITCPHSMFFFRGDIEQFGFVEDFQGNKRAEDLTAHPNPLLVMEHEGECYRAAETFESTSDFIVGAGVTINAGTYLRVLGISEQVGNTHQTVYKFESFSDKIANTLYDWHIAPLERPVIGPPLQKMHMVDIPGANGYLDLSNSLTQYPVFENRTGSLKFAVLSDDTDTPTAYTKILRFLQGTNTKMILEDDPNYYYEGRFYVESIDPKSDGTWTEISIGYDVYPYRRSINKSIDDWLWDPFNFETDVIQQTVFTAIHVGDGSTQPDADGWEWHDFTGLVDMMPINPSFTVDTDSNLPMEALLINTDLGINKKKFSLEEVVDPNTHKRVSKSYYGLIFCEFTRESVVKMAFREKGVVTIEFRSGRL